MKTYAIDATSAEMENRSGVEWYAYHLIEALKRQTLGPDERLVFYSPKSLKWPLPFGWMKGRMTWEMLRNKPNVFLVPAQGLPLAGPCAAVIHDVGWRRVPGVYDAAQRRTLERETRRAVKRSRVLFAVSEFTRRELVETFGAKPERVVVAPNAINPAAYRTLDETTVASVLQRHRLSKHYFLYVGRMDAKKNVKTLIRAFELFKAGRGIGDPFEFVLVGSKGYGFSEIKLYVERSTVRDSIKYFGYLPDTDVAALMNGATGFAFPSWYEGFGVPPLEAAACGCPSVVSDIGAHHEVMQDASLYAAPGEPEAWAKALKRIATDPALRGELRAKGFARAAAYSWDATAKVVLDALRVV